MSPVFAGKFISQFRDTMDILGLDIPPQFISKLQGNKWVVYAKTAFAGPKSVIEYLGRYSHKAAISNYRIKSVTSEKIIFNYKDYRHGGVNKLMPLHPQEFVRRFSLHILPSGFTRIRHYGLLSSKCKATVFPDIQSQPIAKLDWITFWKQNGLNVDVCPKCKKPALILIGEIPKRGPPNFFTAKIPSSKSNFIV